MNDGSSSADEPVDLVFVPALVAVLLNRDQAKGSPLTEDEVIAIRDQASCIAMPRSVAEKVITQRGYQDLDPDHVWDDWCAARPQFYDQSS